MGKKKLASEEEAELTRLWKMLVKLYPPDRFTNQPDKLETYVKLTAAINRAKDSGDIATLREIAEDPHGFILRQGWESLDFSDEAELMRLRRLHETLQLEIINVLESLNRLRESPDYELCQLSEKKAGCWTNWRRSGRSGWKRKAPSWRSRRTGWRGRSRGCPGRRPGPSGRPGLCITSGRNLTLPPSPEGTPCE